KLANPLSAKRAVNVTHFLEKHTDGRQVGRSWHDVICHLAVLHASILPDHFLVQRISDPLSDTAHDLTSSQNWMKDLAHLLQRYEVIYRYAVGAQVNCNFCDINCPGKCRVCLAAVLFIVPEYVAWRFKTGG